MKTFPSARETFAGYLVLGAGAFAGFAAALNLLPVSQASPIHGLSGPQERMALGFLCGISVVVLPLLMIVLAAGRQLLAQGSRGIILTGVIVLFLLVVLSSVFLVLDLGLMGMVNGPPLATVVLPAIAVNVISCVINLVAAIATITALCTRATPPEAEESALDEAVDLNGLTALARRKTFLAGMLMIVGGLLFSVLIAVNWYRWGSTPNGPANFADTAYFQYFIGIAAVAPFLALILFAGRTLLVLGSRLPIDLGIAAGLFMTLVLAGGFAYELSPARQLGFQTPIGILLILVNSGVCLFNLFAILLAARALGQFEVSEVYRVRETTPVVEVPALQVVEEVFQPATEEEETVLAEASRQAWLPGVVTILASLFVFMNLAVNGIVGVSARLEMARQAPRARFDPPTFAHEMPGIALAVVILGPIVLFMFVGGRSVLVLGKQRFIYVGLVLNLLMFLNFAASVAGGIFLLLQGPELLAQLEKVVPMTYFWSLFVTNAVSCVLILAAMGLTVLFSANRAVRKAYRLRAEKRHV